MALFEPDVPGNVSALERYAVATFVAGLHGHPIVAEFYKAALRQFGNREISDVIEVEVSRGSVRGPYGRYPQGPLSDEDEVGLDFRILTAHEQVLGSRLTAALQHAHLLVFRPRDASAAALQQLLSAGWLTTDIVTLSQLVSFLSFQIRLIVGLRTLVAAPEHQTLVAARLPIRTGAEASGSV